jgi:hypothetical protein
MIKYILMFKEGITTIGFPSTMAAMSWVDPLLGRSFKCRTIALGKGPLVYSAEQPFAKSQCCERRRENGLILPV